MKKGNNSFIYRILGCTLRTTEGEEPPAGGGDGAPSHWIDSLTDEHKAAVSGLTAEDALAKLTYTAPEKYVAPEGVNIDEGLFSEASEIAKKYGLSQEAMNDFIGLDAKRTEGFTEKLKEQHKQGLEEMQSKMGNEKFTEALTMAHATMEVFADEEITKYMEDTGLGDSPILIKFFANVGSKLMEGGGPGSGGGPSGQRDNSEDARLRRMYPTMFKD